MDAGLHFPLRLQPAGAAECLATGACHEGYQILRGRGIGGVGKDAGAIGRDVFHPGRQSADLFHGDPAILMNADLGQLAEADLIRDGTVGKMHLGQLAEADLIRMTADPLGTVMTLSFMASATPNVSIIWTIYWPLVATL